MNKILAIITLSLSSFTICSSQRGFWDVEYGIGLVSFRDRENTRAAVFAEPRLSSDTLVILNGWSLRFAKDNMTYHSKGLMVEFSGDGNGFPILGYSSDSIWAKVTVDCTDTSASNIGWILLKQDNLFLLKWPEILPKQGLFFIRDEFIKFFSDPNTKTAIHIKLVPNKTPEMATYSYIMNPIKVMGRWLQVELITPYSPCMFSDDELRNEFGIAPWHKKVWIEYLDKNLRPKVFYYSRGC